MADEARWYVIHTYSGYENKVASNLEKTIDNRNLRDLIQDVRVPTETVTEIKEGGKRVETEKKVLPGYVLVRMELDPDSWTVVRNTPGVTGFVGSQGNPEPLTRDEYNKIMGVGKPRPGVQKKATTSIEVGQTVKVVSGPFVDFDGTVAEVMPDAGKVRVMVSIFGRETPVELSFDQVAKV